MTDFITLKRSNDIMITLNVNHIVSFSPKNEETTRIIVAHREGALIVKAKYEDLEELLATASIE
ncbi:hypothetical protein [Vibrio sp. ER1A]|uniref:hypothetical protein n=1 Tax=Vibrio sp. ER1A TaxID=1517681 RepID=UPI0004DCED6B|nr:hypothetical protein [Vibrio sp. ER1A]KFA98789.1 hypothetical protein HW45_07145 [Vibrio sp. ER1A]